jgi:hypothetical protein
MSYPCDSTQFTCGTTKEALSKSVADVLFTNTEDITFTFTCNGISMPIYIRSRNYQYVDKDTVNHTEVKFVITPAGFGAYHAECFKYDQRRVATIREDYTTTDVTFFYADLRNNLFVYENSIQNMKFEQTAVYTKTNDGITQVEDGQYVEVAHSYGDTIMMPFILEEVPITITDTIVCTNTGVLNTEYVTSGYWDGVRVLMPLFDSGNPRNTFFTINGVEYNAAVVEWYYIPSHLGGDGNSFFWWPDWLKAVGINNGNDANTVSKMIQQRYGYVPQPYTFDTSNGIAIKDFMGSAAIGRYNTFFMSASFDAGAIKINKLTVDGIETEIPKDCECDVWYPIAPI